MDMDTRFDRRVLALAARRSGGVPRGRAMAVAGVAVGAVILGLLVFIWLTTGAGYFWPQWVIAGWGLVLILRLVRMRLKSPATKSGLRLSAVSTSTLIAPLSRSQSGFAVLSAE